MVDLVGAGQVGLGLDYLFDVEEFEAEVQSNPSLYPPDLAGPLAMVQPEVIPNIVEGLCGLGLGDKAIRGILGENWLRIARQVWK